MLFVILTCLLALLLFVAIFVARNMWVRNIAYEQLIETIFTRVDNSYKRMQEVDALGAFEADDDVGYVFKELYATVELLAESFGIQSLDGPSTDLEPEIPTQP